MYLYIVHYNNMYIVHQTRHATSTDYTDRQGTINSFSIFSIGLELEYRYETLVIVHLVTIFLLTFILYVIPGAEFFSSLLIC